MACDIDLLGSCGLVAFFMGVGVGGGEGLTK